MYRHTYFLLWDILNKAVALSIQATVLVTSELSVRLKIFYLNKVACYENVRNGLGT
jgi:hypothetical protein